ncbi:MAG: 3-hydroxyacyl-ACP dehydratase FabZ, partial [Pseudomonadota bacterium]|nr:3-hydroxyacyl-ACP dehydratase FabZ [Pseudomonadota bacterium]
MSMTTQNPADITAEIDINGIQRLIPHRYPFLLVDRLVDIVKGERAVGIKNVTINEPFFEGQFPARPIMPGVLIVESMAQTAGCLVLHTLGTDADNKLVYFMTIDDARFRRPVTPGDQMRILVEQQRSRGNVFKFK